MKWDQRDPCVEAQEAWRAGVVGAWCAELKMSGPGVGARARR
jgi:hypothetical protein